jgi:hypothetical protein
MSAWDCDDDALVGDLSIDGFALNCAAWRIENLIEWWLPAEQRGSDKIRPGVDGSFAVRRRKAATRRTCEMFISGEVDAFGTPAANWMAGMQANLEAFETNLVDPPATLDGTRTALLTMPDGSTRTGPVHVLGMQIAEPRANGRYTYAVIDVSIPAGSLA